MTTTMMTTIIIDAVMSWHDSGRLRAAAFSFFAGKATSLSWSGCPAFSQLLSVVPANYGEGVPARCIQYFARWPGSFRTSLHSLPYWFCRTEISGIETLDRFFSIFFGMLALATLLVISLTKVSY